MLKVLHEPLFYWYTGHLTPVLQAWLRNALTQTFSGRRHSIQKADHIHVVKTPVCRRQRLTHKRTKSGYDATS